MRKQSTLAANVYRQARIIKDCRPSWTAEPNITYLTVIEKNNTIPQICVNSYDMAIFWGKHSNGVFVCVPNFRSLSFLIQSGDEYPNIGWNIRHLLTLTSQGYDNYSTDCQCQTYKSTAIYQKGLWRHNSEKVNCSGRTKTNKGFNRKILGIELWNEIYIKD